MADFKIDFSFAIKFLFIQPGDDFFRVTFGTKYKFAIVGASSGITAAQYAAVEDDAQVANSIWGIGFRYISAGGRDTWLAVALTGPFI